MLVFCHLLVGAAVGLALARAIGDRRRVAAGMVAGSLPALVDNPMTPRLAMDLYSATADALARWEPRFKLTRVRIASATVGQVVLDLEGVYLPDGKVAVLTGLEV